jgi:alcohol dehydrogenase class IV
MKSEFATAGKIIFGFGQIAQFSHLVKGWGQRALLVRGKSRAYGQSFYQTLNLPEFEKTEFCVSHEPDITTINEAVQLARENQCDFVIGFGGGSVIDTGKAVAALLNNEGDLLDYLEVVGKGHPLRNRSKPYIAIPTTAGTGSEVTKNAVISVPERHVKVSMRSNFMLPEIALVDPQFTLGLSKDVTAASGMDAFIQVVEPYVCNSPNAMVDMFCRDAIIRAAVSLPKVVENGFDEEARINMSWVSLMGGLSLANAKLGAVHGFAGPIGGMFDAPHGAVCAALMPSVMRVNSELILTRGSDGEVRERYLRIAQWVTGNEKASINDGARWFEELNAKLNIQPLKSFGVTRGDFPSIIEKAGNSSSMKGNPLELSRKEMGRMLEMAF